MRKHPHALLALVGVSCALGCSEVVSPDRDASPEMDAMRVADVAPPDRTEGAPDRVDARADAAPQDARAPLVCAAGVADCNGRPDDGCEIDTRLAASHCGRCGHVCAFVNAASACVASECALFACNTGFGDCDANAANGCETDLRSSLAHCGACGGACASGAHATAVCREGRCALACSRGWAECDGASENGCETPTLNDPLHCGGCAPCAGEEFCAGGRCVSPPSRARTPMSTARTTSTRPTLRWRLAPGAEAVRVELCADRACARTELSIEAAGDHARPSEPLRPGVHFWRLWQRMGAALPIVPTVVWEFFSPASDARVDTSSGGVPDVDGDGMADVLAHFRDTEGVFVWLSSRGGLRDATPVRINAPAGSVTSTVPCSMTAYQGMGAGLFATGDLDGDGLSEVVAPAPGSYECAGASRRRGNSFLLSGRVSGELALGGARGWWSSGFGVVEPSTHVEIAAGDTDGDGLGEIAALDERGAGSYSVSIGLFRETGSSFGTGGSLVSLGDFNGDGLGDVHLSSFQSVADGVVSRGGVLDRPGAPTCVTRLGGSARALGDVDGDGLADYDEIVSCRSADLVTSTDYFVQHRHDATGAETAVWMPAAGATRHRHVLRDEPGWIGDATGDGLDDVARADSATRRLMLFTWTPDGLSREPSVTVAYPAEANGPADFAHAF